MVPFDLLSCDGLTVITKEDERFDVAVTSRAFISNLPSSDKFPDAVLVATNTHAVQVAVNFCRKYNYRVSPRTGGHNWFSIWLQGNGSIILDVGDINQVEFHADTETIVAGPGATNINDQIPKEFFFPSGHCPMVPLGGYILGNGYGIGFTKYGMAASLVTGMEVVLASGEIRYIKGTDNNNNNNNNKDDDDDEVDTTIMDLMRGSYHRFPAVITKYVLRACKAPKCVLPQSFIFDLKDWKLPIKYGRDIMHRNDLSEDSSSSKNDDDDVVIETTVVFCHCPSDLSKETGMKKMVILSLMAWSDKDEVVTRQVLNNLSERINIAGTAIPSKSDLPIVAHEVAKKCFGSICPTKSRYLCDAYVGDDSVLDMSDEAIYELLEPLALTWTSDDNGLPGPYSHSLLVLLNRNMKQVNGCELISGFVPAFEVMSYSIYNDESHDEINWKKLQRSMETVAESSITWTVPAEGNIRGGGKACYDRETSERITNMIELIDPEGLFLKK
jgi:hypothetical protein